MRIFASIGYTKINMLRVKKFFKDEFQDDSGTNKFYIVFIYYDGTSDRLAYGNKYDRNIVYSKLEENFCVQIKV